MADPEKRSRLRPVTTPPAGAVPKSSRLRPLAPAPAPEAAPQQVDPLQSFDGGSLDMSKIGDYIVQSQPEYKQFNGPLDRLMFSGQAMAEGAADLAGAPGDLVELIPELATNVPISIINALADYVTERGSENPLIDFNLDLPASAQGSGAIKRLGADATRTLGDVTGGMVGGEPYNKFDYHPTDRLGYDMTEAMTASVPLGRGARVLRELGRETPAQQVEQALGYLPQTKTVTGRQVIQDAGAGAGAGVGVHQSESSEALGAEASPLATIVQTLLMALGGSGAAGMVAQAPERIKSVSNFFRKENLPPPSRNLLNVAGDTRREELLNGSVNVADMDQASQALQQAAVNPRAAAATLDQRVADSKTLGDTLTDSFATSGDEGLISVGSGLRSGGGEAGQGTSLPSIMAARDRRVQLAQEQDVASLRIPDADQRAPERVAKAEADALTVENARKLEASEAAAEAARIAARNEGGKLEPYQGGEANASIAADSVLEKTLRRDQTKRESLYDLGAGRNTATEVEPLAAAREAVAEDALGRAPSVRDSLVPESVNKDLRKVFPPKEVDEAADAVDDVPAEASDWRTRDLGQMQKDFAGAAADPKDNVVPLRGKQADGPAPREPAGKFKDPALERIWRGTEDATEDDAVAALTSIGESIKAQADKSPALQKALSDAQEWQRKGHAFDTGWDAEYRATLTDPEDLKAFDAYVDVADAEMFDGDLVAGAGAAMERYHGVPDANVTPLKTDSTPFADSVVAPDAPPRATLQELQDMRANMSREQRLARQEGNFTSVDALRDLKQGIDDTISEFVDRNPRNRAAKQLGKAKEYDNTEFKRWMDGAGGDYRRDYNLDQKGRTSSPPSTALSNYFLRSNGTIGAKERAADLAAIAEKVTDPAKLKSAVREYFMASASGVVGADGTINVNALRNWRNRNSDALKEFPKINEEFIELGRSVDGLDKGVKSTAAALRAARDAWGPTATERQVRQMALSPFIDTEPKKAVASILNGKNPAVDIETLMRKVEGNQAAHDGVKDAISEYFYDQVTGSNAASTTEGVAVSASKMLNQMEKHNAALEKVYTPEEMAKLRRVQRTMRDLQATSVRAGTGSNTADRLAAAKNNIEMLVKLQYGHLAGGSIMRSMRMLMSRVPGLDNSDKVSRILLMAAFDPELASMMLKRPPPPEQLSMFASQVAGRMAVLSGVEEATDDDAAQARQVGEAKQRYDERAATRD